MPETKQKPERPTRREAGIDALGCLWRLALLGVCVVLGALVATDAPASGSVIGYKLAVAGSVVSSYMNWKGMAAAMLPASGHMLGVFLRHLFARRGVKLPPGVAAALGLGTLLTFLHAVWWLAGFAGGLHAFAKWFALLITLGPMALWYVAEWREHKRLLRAGEDPASLATRGPLRTSVPILIIAAACFVLPYATVPPGILWPSEYGGYDALSYHLPLAQEWYTQGFIAPTTHNVYSFLPSYFEGAFVHLAAADNLPQAAAPSADGPQQVAVGFLAKDGSAALGPQLLATFTLGLAAWSVAGLVRVLAERIGLGVATHTSDPRLNMALDVACMIAAGLVMTTPWMVVVSTLAYNEAPMVAMLAAALSCALYRPLGPRARGILCGVLTGFACCIKPSALVLGAPMVGIAMLVGCWGAAGAAGAAGARGASLAGRALARTLGVCVALCLLAGAITISPWLIRNAIAAGNPVFPFAASVLGHGHWTKEQAARYAAAHKPDRGVVSALELLVLPDSRVAPDAPAVQRYRGVTNPQWMPLAPIAAIALIALLVRCESRRTGLVLLAGSGAVAIAWAGATHAQSRFLVVLVPIAAAGTGVAVAQLLLRGAASSARGRHAGVAIALVLIALTAAVWLTIGPSAQAARLHALATAIGGPNSLNAIGYSEAVKEVRSDRQQVNRLLEQADPVRFVPLQPRIDLRRVLLIGDATPFYFGPVDYRTTWDTWPILTQMEEHPDQPAEWTRGLRNAGYDFALVNMSEIARLSSSGYLDPRLTPERIGEWMRTTQLVRAWNDRGAFLLDLREGQPNAGPR